VIAVAPSEPLVTLERGDVLGAVAEYRRQAVLVIQQVMLVGALVCLIAFRDALIVQTAVGAMIAASLASLWCAFRRRLPLAVLIMAGQFVALPTTLAFIALGVYDSSMYLLPAGMLTLSVLESPSRVALFATLAFIAAGTVYLGSLNGWVQEMHRLSDVDIALDGLVMMTVMTLAGVVAVYVSDLLKRLLTALAENSRLLETRVAQRTAELSAANDDLTHALHSLERAKDELVRGEKLAGLGNLVAGVAHELNTPIGNATVAASTLNDAVTEFGQRAATGQLKRSELQGFVGHCSEGSQLVLRSLNRAHELISSFKQIAVDQASERRRGFALGDLAHDVLRTLRAAHRGEPWRYESDVPEGIVLDSYPGPLTQVLTNLVQNAIVHGFSGRDHGSVRIGARFLGKDRVEVTVSDDGRGIDVSTVPRIFDPFFTTRLGQGGSGLGLAIVHNIVTGALGGRVTVSSTPGAGACFTLDLPLQAPAPNAN
jgi:signal transduction histidine kinase